MIPVSRPDIGPLERDRVLQAMLSGWITSGRVVREFEAGLARLHSTSHAIACSSGTTALQLALSAAGVGPGAEVIVPTLTFAATAGAVRAVGAEPVFVDVLGDGTIDGDLVARALTDRTAAVIPVHLYGAVARVRCDLPAGVAVIEDSCEAFGTEPSPASFAACLSFYANKAITTGEGGAVLTNSRDAASRLRVLNGQGQGARRFWHEAAGFNYRMTDLQAAIGCAQLGRYAELLSSRHRTAMKYRRNGLNLWPEIAIPWLPNVRTKSPESLAAHLARQGIETRPVFPPVHQMPPYRECRHYGGRVAEELSQTHLSLPLWSGMSDEIVDRICREVKEWQASA